MPTQTQIVNGQQVTPYSPEWYQAQDQDAIHRAGVGGTAAGTGESNYLKELSPSLTGLYASMGLNGGGSSTPTVGYPGGGASTSSAAPGSVSYSAGSVPDLSSGKVSSSDLVNGASTALPDVSTIDPVNFDAANSAAFATAKDQAARTAQASMRGLQGALSARGMGGAGYEAGQIGGTLAREANTIGEAGRAQAVNEANLRARAAEANLGAQVTQRGQTIGARESDAARRMAGLESAYSGDISQRGQDIGAKEAAANIASERAATSFQGDIAQRGQDVGLQESDLAREAAARNADYEGQITQRGQDITSAAEQARLKSQQTLAILQSVLGGGQERHGVPGYVY